MKRLIGPVVAIALIAVLVLQLDAKQLWHILSSAHWVWLLPSALLLILGNTISALRWVKISRAFNLGLDTRVAIRLYFQGVTLNTTLPGAIVGGDLWRTAGLRRSGNPWLGSAFSVLFDRVSGVWALALIALLAVVGLRVLGSLPPSLPIAGWWLAVMTFGSIVFLPLLPGIGRLSRALRALGADHRLASKALKLVSLLDQIHHAQKLLWRTLPASLAVQFLSIAALMCCQSAVGIQIDAVTSAALGAALFISAIIPISMSGFGTRELAAAGLYSLIGESAQQGVAASVLLGLSHLAVGMAAAMLVPPSMTDVRRLERDAHESLIDDRETQSR